MKKSTKIILIVSAALVFGGILIAGISGAVGGTRQFKELSEKQALNFDLPWGDAKLKLTTDGLYFANDNAEDAEPKEEQFSEATVNTADIEMSEVKNIEMELGAGEFELEKSSDGVFHISENGMNLITEFNGGTLCIRTKNKNNVQILGFDTGVTSSGKAVIYLPEQVYEEISIDMGAGTCKGDVPECEKLSVSIGAGECDLDYIKAGEADIRVGAGECKIGLIDAQELNADVAMGEFEAKAMVGSELDAKVGMGEIKMEIVGEETDFDYDVEVGAGEVRIGSRSYSGVGSGGSQKNGLDREIDVECGMGEATLDFVKE